MLTATRFGLRLATGKPSRETLQPGLLHPKLFLRLRALAHPWELPAQSAATAGAKPGVAECRCCERQNRCAAPNRLAQALSNQMDWGTSCNPSQHRTAGQRPARASIVELLCYLFDAPSSHPSILSPLRRGPQSRVESDGIHQLEQRLLPSPTTHTCFRIVTTVSLRKSVPHTDEALFQGGLPAARGMPIRASRSFMSSHTCRLADGLRSRYDG